MSFGVIFYVENTNIVREVSNHFNFRFNKKDRCNIFPYLEKKRGKKIIQPIRAVNAYPNKSND